MSKQEILDSLKHLVKEADVKEMLKEVPALEEAWEKAHDAEVEIAKQKFIEAGGEERDFDPPKNELSGNFKELYNLYLEKRAAHKRALQEAEERNFTIKTEIVAELKALVDGEMDNIGKAFNTFDELNTRWAETGQVNKARFKRLQEEYSSLRDVFFHHTKIYKQLKAYDFEKNLAEKQAVIAELKKVLEIESIRKTEQELHALQEKWDAIGPTTQEAWEAVKEEYWSTVHAIYDKIRAHYKAVREKQAEVEEVKRQHVQRMETILVNLPNRHSDWQKLTEEVIALQKTFWSAGYTKRSKESVFRETFKGLCDAFFDKKSVFYEKQRSQFAKRKEEKEKLIAQAEEMKDATDWQPVTKRFIALQKQWKKVGPAHPKDEGALWKRFRSACDTFFNAKKEWFDGRADREAANLAKKNEIVEQLATLPTVDEVKQAIEQWNAVGYVPKKEVGASRKAFDKAVKAAFERLGVNENKQETLAFEAKVEGMAEQKQGDKRLADERRFIQGKIRTLQEDIEQYRNNLSFFGPSKGAQKLREAAERRIEESESELENWKAKLKLVKEKLK